MTRPACEGCDTDYWFSSDPDDIEFALHHCLACPVRVACLETALEAEAKHQIAYRHIAGIYGGMTPGQRFKILRAQRHARNSAQDLSDVAVSADPLLMSTKGSAA